MSGALAATAEAHYPTATPTPVIYTPTPVSLPLGTNLLTDGGFEGRLYIPCSKYNDLPWHHISCEGLDLKTKDAKGHRINIMWDTVQVPIGWVAWWYPPNTNTSAKNFYQDHPNNCYADAPEGCIPWHNPEFRDTKGIIVGPSRIHSGSNSVKYFTLWSVHEAGLMQTISGVTPGTLFSFSAYMEAWSATEDGEGKEPSPYQSGGQTSMHMKVGIDPYGGDDPWSPNILWSPEKDSYDNWGYYEVRAVAQSGKVTFFTHSMPEKPLKHNDMYVDDAELVAISLGDQAPVPADQPPAPAAASGAPPAVIAAAPPPTALPRPDGAIVHIVQPGDTLFGLALQYDVPMDQILQLNGLTSDSLLQINQELVIAAPSVTPTPTPGPTEPAATPTPVAIAAAPAKTQLCVRAFNDLNANAIYTSSESLVSGGSFTVLDRQGNQIAQYSSDGVSEPHCFTRLQPGSYSVSVDPAPDTVATSDRLWSVKLDSGVTVDVDFGSQPSKAKTPAKSAAASNADASGSLGLLLVVVGLGAAGWYVVRRRNLSVG